MHGMEEFRSDPNAIVDNKNPWWKDLNRYHWFVLVVAALGWLFDTMDQQLFNLARVPAMRELLKGSDGTAATDAVVAVYGGYATSIFLIGWASGGLFFGVLGDKIGRAKTMMLTILIYSLCTGLSALSTGFWDFAFYRFITGLGVGGEFAVGVSLVAEVMPNRARPFALGLLQALSAVGNVTAALIAILLGRLEETGAIGSAWRVMFVIGALPALLAILIRRNLKEPERWQQLQASGGSETIKRAGSYAELFGHPVWRKRALLGMLLAFSGVVGLWGIGFFSIDLTRSVLRKTFEAQGVAPEAIAGKLTFWAGMTSVMLNIGAFFGIYGFAQVTHYTGRKPAFAVAFVAAGLSTAMVFLYLREFSQIFWMVPIMGFCQLALFGGYAIYFPELFPTHLRSTGTSFCYNVGRFVAAAGPTTLGLLTGVVFKDSPEPMRPAGLAMCSVFVIGLLVLPFLPETKGQPLPE
ncbi:MAG TPA: MFS transporter [Planctomycetaceae bacterium]|nr:MFS transporter [Planctomycetaceae bacterium]